MYSVIVTFYARNGHMVMHQVDNITSKQAVNDLTAQFEQQAKAMDAGCYVITLSNG